MDYKIEKNDNQLNISVNGRVDTTTVAELENGIFDQLNDDVESVVMDLQNLEYISSAGLRLLLKLQKKMNANKGQFTVTNTNAFVSEILSMTGFNEIINIK